MSSKLICRYCKDDHLSIQCPTKKTEKKPVVLNLKNNENNKTYNKNNLKEKILVKMHPLPLDLMKMELLDLLKPWGPIGKVFIKKEKTSEFQAATIEFLKKSEGKKAIYQLNDTFFDYLKINVEELNSKNYH